MHCFPQHPQYIPPRAGKSKSQICFSLTFTLQAKRSPISVEVLNLESSGIGIECIQDHKRWRSGGLADKCLERQMPRRTNACTGIYPPVEQMPRRTNSWRGQMPRGTNAWAEKCLDSVFVHPLLRNSVQFSDLFSEDLSSHWIQLVRSQRCFPSQPRNFSREF